MALAEQVYDFYCPSVSKMGVGAAKTVGQTAVSLGCKNALIVTDKGLLELGMADEIKKLIEEAGITAIIWGGVEPNPTDLNARDGLQVYQKHNCDSLVSLGGGSSHDCAKGIGIVATNGGDIRDYQGINNIPKSTPPTIAVNTTAGTASEMTCFAVITNTDEKVKMIFFSSILTPNVAINDPLMMKGLPASLTASTGMDALTHAVEAYVSPLANPVTDACAIGAIKLITQYLPQAVANGDNLFARDKMAYGEFLAGMAFGSAGAGVVHALAHQPGALLNKPHGTCNAILLPYGCSYNLIACPERYADIAVAMGEDITGLTAREAGAKGIEAMKNLSEAVGIPSSLTDIGVKETDIELLADKAINDVCCLFNPRKVKRDDLVMLFKKAL